MLYPFVGYAPDADPTQPGVIVDCAKIVPSLRGMKSAPVPVASTLPALAAACTGAASLKKLDETVRTFAGSATKLYEAGSGTWTDRTRAVGGDYASAADVRWRFAQYGNVSLAVNKSDILQFSSSGAFANVGAAVPKAGVVETVGLFVFLFNTNEASYSDSPDRWWCCAIGDYTDWSPNISTQCATGRLLSAPGKIRGAKKFGENIIAYKERSMFMGVYVGPPAAWDFRQVPGEVGALSHESIANIGTPENPKHIFMGADDFYMFDGSRPLPIGTNRVKENVFGQLQRSRREQCIAMHDPVNSLVYFWYPTADSTNPDRCVVYNYKSDKWGRSDLQVEFAFEYTTPATTYADVGTLFTLYGDVNNVSYGGSYWISNNVVPAIMDTSNILQTLNGSSGASSITTGDIGDDNVERLITRVRPRFLTAPNSATMTNYFRHNIGDSLSSDQTVNYASGRFDVMREARWHRLQMNFVGNAELPGLSVDMEAGGSE